MRIFHEIPSEHSLRNPVITIGSFDGTHNGHRRIFSTLLNTARVKSGEAVVLTFDTHPRKILTPKTPPRILTTPEEKIRAIASCGIENIIMLRFTREMADMTASEFFNDLILKRMGIIDVVAGYDHAFGKNREGNAEFLRDLSRARGFAVTRVEPKNFYSRPISSTWIRTELEDGNIALATSLLGRRYTLSGRVMKGVGRGRGIGFPTANVMPDDTDKVVPKDGVYAVMVSMGDGLKKQGMLNIGTNPTFASTERTIEVNIFDFREDIYGAAVELEFCDRLRDEVKFPSADELVDQLKKDKINALELLRNYEEQGT